MEKLDLEGLSLEEQGLRAKELEILDVREEKNLDLDKICEEEGI